MLFYVTVLVPASTPVEDIALGVDELMAPYENTNAWGYQGPQAPEGICRCGYVRARAAAQAIADKLYPSTKEDGQFDGRLLSMLSSMKVYKVAFAAIRRYELHSPACRVCGGTGRYPEALEPKNKFDGSVWGGSYWDGWITGTPRKREPGESTRLEDNLTTVTALLERRDRGEHIVTYALVTPDGFWYENPSFWREDSAFEQGFFERLERHRDCWAVGVECHA